MSSFPLYGRKVLVEFVHVRFADFPDALEVLAVKLRSVRESYSLESLDFILQIDLLKVDLLVPARIETKTLGQEFRMRGNRLVELFQLIRKLGKSFIE